MNKKYFPPLVEINEYAADVLLMSNNDNVISWDDFGISTTMGEEM